MDQDVLNLVRLLDLDADADTVDTGLDEDALVLVAGYRQGVQEDFGRGSRFDFRDIVPFGCLGSKVGERKGGSEGGADALEVWAE